jgi:hypothetical protein
MSNFICVNRPLRFDPSLVTFCKHSLQSARLSKGYLRAVVLAPNARHLSHALPACRLGKARCPLRLIRVFAGKNRHHQTWIYFSDAQPRERLRRPWMNGVPGIRSRPLGGKTYPSGFYVSRPFSTPRFGTEPRQPTIDAEGARGA